MADWLTPEQRSRNMAAIRSQKNRTTEETFARMLRAGHISGWRRHGKLPGKPDFIFQLQRVVVFIDGCFWHGCPKCYRLPEDNRGYWQAKVLMNRRRDRRNVKVLKKCGWTVLRLWEHALKTAGGRLRALRRLEAALTRSA